MSSSRIAVGARVSSSCSLKGGSIPAGMVGVIEQDDGTPNFPYFVRFDNGLCHWCDEAELCVAPSTTASHYQPVRNGIPAPVPVLDDDADDLSTSVTADAEEIDYLAITRSFCR